MAIKGRKIPLERGSEKSSEREIEKEREGILDKINPQPWYSVNQKN